MTNINSTTLKQMLIRGSELISNNYEYIDELNVFPVPDGDTGTNMKITVMGAVDTIVNEEFAEPYNLAKTYARGLLMNARGNSGVILSQIFKGFANGLVQGQNELTISDFVKAMASAKIAAYKSVATPVEGTILTVIRVVSEKLLENSGAFSDFKKLMDFVVVEANIILEKTPDFLIELKNVGVVDSGGYGLCKFFEGMRIGLETNEERIEQKTLQSQKVVTKTLMNKAAFVDDNEGFGYCTEFIMKLKSKVAIQQDEKEEMNEEEFKEQMNKLGDSFVYARDEDIVKVHIHTTKPYEILEYASKFGEFNRVKIENMTLQFLQRNPGSTLEQATKSMFESVTDAVKIIATVPSETIQKFYANEFKITDTLNCENIGNPSIQQFLDLIKQAKSRNIILITDNGNVLLAANQASELVNKKDCEIKIVPAKDIASSYHACLLFDPLSDIETNYKNMMRALKNCEVGKISMAVKTVKYPARTVSVGDTIGIIGKEVVANSKEPIVAIKHLIRELISREKKANIATVITGKDATIRDTRDIEKFINEEYGIKCNIVNGEQSTYSYYVAITRT